MNYLGPELEKFADQIKYALMNYRRHGKKISDFKHIVISGLGGSGIAGKIIKNYYIDKIDIPIETVSDYQLPKFVNKDTLVILCSYSGNTEETLSCYANAQAKGATCMVLTVGGILAELAAMDKVMVFPAVGGYQPRVAFGYPITYLFLIFAELLDVNIEKELRAVLKASANFGEYKLRSNYIMSKFDATIRNKYVIISSPDMEGIAIRFAQQVQENAKLEAFVVVIPEANHNVIETYYGKWDTNYIMLNSGSNDRINLRFKFIKELLLSYNSSLFEMDTEALSIEHLYDTVYAMDWMSLQLAHKVGAVSNQIKNIIKLKEFLIVE